MRTNLVWERYQFCTHLLSDRSIRERHYCAAGECEWLCLCAACHAAHGRGVKIELANHSQRLLAKTHDVPDETSSPPASVMQAARHAQVEDWFRRRATRTDADDEFEELALSARLLQMAIESLPGAWSPTQVADRLHALRLRMKRALAAAERDKPTPPARNAQIMTSTVQWVQERITLAQEAHKRCGRLLRQASHLLTATRAEPWRAFYYRRGTYRRLVRQRRDLDVTLGLLGMPVPARPTLLRELADTFQGLQFFYGGPLSDAALRRFLKQLPISLADIPLLVAALRTCDCVLCAYMRSGAAFTQEAGDATLTDCACAMCQASRVYLLHIDPNLFAKTPDVREALLALRERIGDTRFLN